MHICNHNGRVLNTFLRTKKAFRKRLYLKCNETYARTGYCLNMPAYQGTELFNFFSLSLVLLYYQGTKIPSGSWGK